MRSFRSLLPIALAVASVASSACSSGAAPAPSPPLWSSTSTGIAVTRHGVNEPRPDGASCWSSRYTFFASGELRVESCLGENATVRDVLLLDADVGPIATALGALRDVAPSTTACDPKAPWYDAQVFDREKAATDALADGTNGCHAVGSRTVEALDRVFAALGALEPIMQPVWSRRDSRMVLARAKWDSGCDGEVFELDVANARLSHGECKGNGMLWSHRIPLTDADVARLRVELSTLRWVAPSPSATCATDLLLLSVDDDPSRDYVDQPSDCLDRHWQPVEPAALQQVFSRLHDMFRSADVAQPDLPR